MPSRVLPWLQRLLRTAYVRMRGGRGSWVVGSQYPTVLAWSLSSCCSVLMVLVCVCRGVVSIRTVGLSRVFSLCSRRWQPDCYHLRLPNPLPLRNLKISCFSRRRSALSRGNRVIVRLLHSGFVRLCWLQGIVVGLCREVVG